MYGVIYHVRPNMFCIQVYSIMYLGLTVRFFCCHFNIITHEYAKNINNLLV